MGQIALTKLLYIAIGVIVFISVGWLVMNGTLVSTPLVKIKTNMNGSVTATTNEGEVTVGNNSNKFPDDWPTDAPKYDNAAVKIASSHKLPTGEAAMVVQFDTSDSRRAVIDFHNREFVKNGWKTMTTSDVGSSTIVGAKKDTRTFMLSIVGAASGHVTATVSIYFPKQFNKATPIQ